MSIRCSTRGASWLVCGLLSLSSCTGAIDDGVTGGSSSGGAGTSGNSNGLGGASAGSSAQTGGNNGQPATGGASTPGGTSATGGGSVGGTSAGGSSTSGAGAGGDPYAVPASPPPSALVPTSRLARLSRQQWSNTIRDLLKLTDISDVENDISGDALVGFDTQGDALFVGEALRQEYATAAERLAGKVTGDAAALARLVPSGAPTDVAGRGRAFISSFGQRAFRRPLTDAEVTTHVGLFNQGPTLYPGVDAFSAGVSLVIQAMLQSPHFLYRTELGTAAAGAASVPLSDYEVASKLAYALTNTMPDDTLFAAAAAGQLKDRANAITQAKRLLDGPRGKDGLSNFQLQVFRLGTYDGITRDPAIFPDFKPDTPAAMRTEVLRFLEWMFTQGRGVKDFYTTPVGFVNSTLAPLYGLSGNFTKDTFTKVDLDPAQRSGLLTQAGFLSSYITGSDPDIIHRGVFIALRLLCVELPPPSPLATPLPEFQPNMSNRERVEKTTGKGTCGEGCHAALINPLGYAFENYDALGKYRTVDHGKPVDAASSALLDGTYKSFSNGVELSHLIAEAKQTHGCYAQNMMTYLHGRLVTPADQPSIDYFARLSRAGMVSLHDLALALVTSDAFLTRLP
ncbi:MAG TPA: DUF1592 domain-containing protein [Polyangiaceae bacterium]|nr:DUF1592 domain-containing protein [Polyangiaceae bacterium]